MHAYHTVYDLRTVVRLTMRSFTQAEQIIRMKNDFEMRLIYCHVINNNMNCVAINKVAIRYL